MLSIKECVIPCSCPAATGPVSATTENRIIGEKVQQSSESKPSLPRLVKDEVDSRSGLERLCLTTSRPEDRSGSATPYSRAGDSTIQSLCRIHCRLIGKIQILSTMRWSGTNRLAR